MPARSYNQNCPIARGLDVLGERWTLLILRELVGGPRRYGDLRAELPGIATNLLADRLRELEDAGLVDRTELPPPVARTVYTLSDTGWRKVLYSILSLGWQGTSKQWKSHSRAVLHLSGLATPLVLSVHSVVSWDFAMASISASSSFTRGAGGFETTRPCSR